MHRKGFTLIEIAIVLVIIGLLIGGILVAQSMIETAGINNKVRRLQQYEVAVSNHQLKYTCLPGDSNKIAPAAGNCNGLIGDGTSFVMDTDANEIKNFWPQLQATEMIDKEVSYAALITGANFCDAANGFRMPALYKKNETGSGTEACLIAFNSSGTNYWKTVYSLYGNSGGDSGHLLPIKIFPIDSKIDDGLPNTGNMRAVAFTTGNFSSFCFWDGGGSYASPNYHGGPSPNICSIMIKMFATRGER